MTKILIFRNGSDRSRISGRELEEPSRQLKVALDCGSLTVARTELMEGQGYQSSCHVTQSVT